MIREISPSQTVCPSVIYLDRHAVKQPVYQNVCNLKKQTDSQKSVYMSVYLSVTQFSVGLYPTTIQSVSQSVNFSWFAKIFHGYFFVCFLVVCLCLS